MPQFQMIPAAPSFGEQLGQALGSGISGGLSASLNSYLENKKQQSQFNQLTEALRAMQTSEEGSEYQDLLAAAAAEKAGLPQVGAGIVAQGKERRKREQAEIPEKEAQTALQEMEGMIGKEGIGISSVLNPSGAALRNRGKFKSLQSKLMGNFTKIFPRITEKEFEFIQKNYIPQWHDSEETMRGKIEGLKRDYPGVLGGEGLSPSMPKKTEDFESFVNVQAPDGSLRKVPKSKLKDAISMGGKLVQ